MLTIEQMALSPRARAAAEALKAAHPAVVFTSGRRNVAGQARAMAANVSLNLNWIAQTYAPTPQREALQDCCHDIGPGAPAAAYAAALEGLMATWTDTDLAHVSKHLSGDAFDVQPIDGPAGEVIKAAIRQLPGLTKFLEREGGLVRWHAQFA